MIEILIVTHGSLAKGLIETAQLIVGDVSNISDIGFRHGDDPDDLIQLIKEKVEGTLKKKNELLIFADLLGGSPSNRIAMCLNKMKDTKKVEAIVGVNLPMLLEAMMLSDTDCTIQEIKESSIKSGTEGIKDLKNTFGL